MWVSAITIVLVVGAVNGADVVIYNEQTDKYVQMANDLSKQHATIPLEDIHPNLPIFSLPIFGTFSMAVDGFVGEMGDRRTLRRQFDAHKYSSSCNETLLATFHYDNLIIKYDYVLADFLYFFRFNGALKIRIENNMFGSSITKTCTQCIVNGLEVEAFQNYDTHVDMLGPKWNPINWIMKTILAYGFNHFNTYYIMKVIDNQVQELFEPFISTYCSNEKPTPVIKYRF